MTVEAEGRQQQQWQVTALLLVVFAFAAALRFRGLGLDSIWWDEAATFEQVNGSLGDVIARTARDTYPPAYNILAWFSVQVFGETEFGLRFPAAVLGSLSIPVTYLLGRQVGGAKVALFAAVLMALSPFAIFYSQEARPYALLCLAAALHLLLLLRTTARPKLANGVALTLSAAVLLYSHPYGLFAWASAGAGLLVAAALRATPRRAFWTIALSEAAAAVLFAPWAYILAQVSNRLAETGFWLARPGVWDALAGLRSVTSGIFMSIAVLVLVIIAIVARPRAEPVDSAEGTKPSIYLPILIASAFGPVILGYGISQVTTPVYHSRYLICTLPALIVLASIGAGALASTYRRTLGIVSVLLVLCGVSLWTASMRHVEDWRGVAKALQNSMTDTDCLLTNGSSGRDALGFYLRRKPECEVNVRRSSELSKVDAYNRLFLVISHEKGKSSTYIESLPGDWSARRWNYEGVEVTILDRKAS